MVAKMTYYKYKLIIIIIFLRSGLSSSSNNLDLESSKSKIIELKNLISSYKNEILDLKQSIQSSDQLVNKIKEIKASYLNKIEPETSENNLLIEQLKFIENKIDELNKLKDAYIKNALNENAINNNDILNIFSLIINSFEQIEKNIKGI
jgi:hypothetical protein